MERLFKQTEDKLCVLLSFLTRLPEKLEMLADEIDNENLRNALYAVAVESTEYARELKAQLLHLEIIPPLLLTGSLEEEIIEKGLRYTPQEKGKEVLSICENCEAFFSQLYTALLTDYFSIGSLRNMMSYQLLGIQSAFMRIRFLNSLRFNIN